MHKKAVGFSIKLFHSNIKEKYFIDLTLPIHISKRCKADNMQTTLNELYPALQNIFPGILLLSSNTQSANQSASFGYCSLARRFSSKVVI